MLTFEGQEKEQLFLRYVSFFFVRFRFCCVKQEIFNDVADWKEAFNVVIGEVIRLGLTWPNEEFRVAMEQMFGRLKVLALRFLTVLALGKS